MVKVERKPETEKNTKIGEFIKFAEIGGYTICIIGLGDECPCILKVTNWVVWF